MIAVLIILAMLILPALARTQPDSRAFQCRNNLSQMYRAWRMYADDYNDTLLASLPVTGNRVVWVTGGLDFNGGNASNWDVTQDLAKSPIQPYLGTNSYMSWKCPTDQSSVAVPGMGVLPRVRSISMSSVFDFGGWLPSPPYRVYAKGSDILNPAKTWVFMDEHPDSINDGAFAWQMAPAGSTTASIVDFPASYHDGGCNLSFADGHSEGHKWIGLTIRPPVNYSAAIPLNVPAGNSLSDIIWLSSVTTVHQ